MKNFFTGEEMGDIVMSTKLESNNPPYANPPMIKKLDDLPRKAAIHFLRMANRFRARGNIDDFIDNVLTLTADKAIQKYPFVLDIVGQMHPERKEEIDRIKEDLDKMLIGVQTDIGNIYQIFGLFAEYLFVMFDKAHYFQDEPEYRDLIGKTVFEVYKTEIDPDKVKKLDDLTKNDAIRLVRVINSFRRKDTVDRFLSEMDFDNIYDLFSLYIGYIFHEYDKANYFLDEPELDPKETEFQEKEFGDITKFEGEFD